jgi:RNA polymerase sigma-70 factor (ECF subfamily)
VRADLCAEGIRLGRVLVELMPGEPEAEGLLALMLLTESRRPARTGADGSLIPLAAQDRRRWEPALRREGLQLVRKCLRRNRPGPFQIQAAINAVHADADETSETDWRQIVQLYDQLMAVAPSPVVALNRAVAIAEIHGPAVALELVDELALVNYHLYHAIRAELLTRLGCNVDAAAAFDAALAHTDNIAEREFLSRRREVLTEPPHGAVRTGRAE